MAQVSVHIPPRLLRMVDERAHSSAVSRSRLVTLALEQFVGPPQPVLLDEVLAWNFQILDPDAIVAIDAVLEAP